MKDDEDTWSQTLGWISKINLDNFDHDLQIDALHPGPLSVLRSRKPLKQRPLTIPCDPPKA